MDPPGGRPHVSATKVRARSNSSQNVRPIQLNLFMQRGNQCGRARRQWRHPPLSQPSPPLRPAPKTTAPRRASPSSAAMDVAPGEEPPAAPSGEHPPPAPPLPGRDVIPPWRVLCYAYAGGIGSGLARGRWGFRVGINMAGAAFAFALLGRGVGLGGLGFMAVRDFVRVGRG